MLPKPIVFRSHLVECNGEENAMCSKEKQSYTQNTEDNNDEDDDDEKELY